MVSFSDRVTEISAQLDLSRIIHRRHLDLVGYCLSDCAECTSHSKGEGNSDFAEDVGLIHVWRHTSKTINVATCVHNMAITIPDDRGIYTNNMAKLATVQWVSWKCDKKSLNKSNTLTIPPSSKRTRWWWRQNKEEKEDLTYANAHSIGHHPAFWHSEPARVKPS